MGQRTIDLTVLTMKERNYLNHFDLEAGYTTTLMKNYKNEVSLQTMKGINNAIFSKDHYCNNDAIQFENHTFKYLKDL